MLYNSVFIAKGNRMKKTASSYESVSGTVNSLFPSFHETPEEPMKLALSWFKYAQLEKVREPRSMVLSTVNSAMEITSRVMAIIEFNYDGIVFATHSCSRKISDISVNNHACAHLYWKELARQLSIAGSIEEMPRETAEKVWAGRPVPLHSMSSVSRQSEPLQSPGQIMHAANALAAKGALPCPDHFSVYKLVPDYVEFWSASSDRLHNRLRFKKENVHWNVSWLQP